MATDTEDLVLTISADVRQMQRALDRMMGDSARATAAVQKSFDAMGSKTSGVFDRVGANSNRAASVVEANARRFNAAMKGSTMQTANLAAQLQDIGVQLQSGASPLTIALQQGTQIGAAFGNAGAAGAVRAMGAAFASVLSPVNLVTVALIAAGGYAVQYFTAAEDDSKALNKALKDQADLIQRVAQRWGDAVPALKQYADELKRAQEESELGQVTQIRIEEVFEDAKETVRLLRVDLAALVTDLRTAGAADDEIIKVQKAFEAFSKAVNENRDSTKENKELLSALSTVYINSGVPAANAFAASIYGIADAFAKVSAAAQKAREDEQRAFDANLINITGPQSQGGRVRYRSFDLPSEAPTPDRRVDPYFDDAADNAGKKMAKSFKDAIASDSSLDAIWQRIVGVESGGNRLAKNPRSSATGPAQFIDSTWLAYFKKTFEDAKELTDAQILSMRTNTETVRAVWETFTRDNINMLQKAGVAINDAAIYLAHFAGAQGAIDIYRAAPGTPVSQVLGQSKVDANPFLSGMTTGDLIAWAQRKMDMPVSNIDAATQAMKAFEAEERKAQQSAQQLGAAIGGALNSLINAFADGKLEAQEMLQIVLQLISALSNMGGGTGGGFMSGLLGAIFHEGGVVGQGGPKRRVSPLAFAGAPRYHSGGIAGLKPGEVPAILQRGEIIIPRGRSVSSGSSVVIHAPINAPGADAAALARVESSVKELGKRIPSMVDARTKTRDLRRVRA